MLTRWTKQRHAGKRQPCAGMPGVSVASGLSLSLHNTFGGGLIQERSTDRRYIRH